jgi:protein BCP1
MPHEITPPMYTMLLEEIKWAVAETEPYSFTHYLILSKTYQEIASSLPSTSTSTSPPSKKRSKKGGNGEEGETFFFHPEDEVLHKHALGYASFEYDTPVDEGASDSKRAFQELGVRPKGHFVLVEAGRFEGAVEAVRKFLNGQ